MQALPELLQSVTVRERYSYAKFAVRVANNSVHTDTPYLNLTSVYNIATKRVAPNLPKEATKVSVLFFEIYLPSC